MKNNLAFVLWASEEPYFCAAGVQRKFVDGTCIELIYNIPQYLSEKGWAFSQVFFTVVMESNGELLTTHRFQLENMQGNSIWIVANPELHEPNPSFTPVFARQFLLMTNSGQRNVTFRLFVACGEEEEEIADGTLIFDSNLGVSEYRKLMNLLENVQQTRQNVQNTYRPQEREAFVRKVAREHASSYFHVSFKNQNLEQTIYVICRNNKTNDDEMIAVYPGATETTSLLRGASYKILTHGQNETIKHAREMGNLDERYENETILIR